MEIYDGTRFKSLGTIPTEAYADAGIYDRENKLSYVGNGGKDADEDYCLTNVLYMTSGQQVADTKVDSNCVEATGDRRQDGRSRHHRQRIFGE